MIQKALYSLAIVCLLPMSLNAGTQEIRIRNKSGYKVKVGLSVDVTYGKGTTTITKDLEDNGIWQLPDVVRSIQISKYLKPNTYGSPVSFDVLEDTKEIWIQDDKAGSFTINQFEKKRR